MAKSNNQKAKILYLQKMLMQTGENKAISMQQILSELLEKGISAERKSIYDDMEVLRSFGMDIRYKREKPGGYYLAGTDAVEEAESVKMEKVEKPEPIAEEKKKCPVKIVNNKKPLKFLCYNSKKQEIMDLFGDYAEYKEKNEVYFQMSISCEEDEELYSWLVLMNESVRFNKPKKSVQAYKNYLKKIVKEYKGI